MDAKNPSAHLRNLIVFRRLLYIAAAVYMLWWFAVEWLLPGAFNPLGSRMLVAVINLAIPLLSYVSAWVRRNIAALFYVCMWLISLHYFYLMNGNSADFNWVVGSYITVLAVSLGFLSSMALLFYSIFVLSLSLVLCYYHPQLAHSVFLPGLVTILLQANFGLYGRLRFVGSLEESNKRFINLFDFSFDGVLVHGDGKITDCNESMAAMLGYKKTDLIGKSVFDVVHPDEKAAVIENMKMPTVNRFEMKMLKSDGSSIELEVRAKEFRFEGKTSRLVTAQDTTDRKKAESERVAAASLLENLRVRDEFISLASHELKTPISALQLQTQMIEQDLSQKTAFSPEKISEFIALFGRQVHRLNVLVGTLLDASQIAAGHLILDKAPVEPAALLREAVQAAIAPAFEVVMSVEPAIEHFKIMADPIRLRQVIDNLLSNAMKYGRGKPVRVGLRSETERLILSVADEGIGIPLEAQKRIFGRFERAVSSRHVSGLGLGLYIARQIVELHGGSIAVQSQVGVGSTFTVTLPFSA